MFSFHFCDIKIAVVMAPTNLAWGIQPETLSGKVTEITESLRFGKILMLVSHHQRGLYETEDL